MKMSKKDRKEYEKKIRARESETKLAHKREYAKFVDEVDALLKQHVLPRVQSAVIQQLTIVNPWHGRQFPCYVVAEPAGALAASCAVLIGRWRGLVGMEEMRSDSLAVADDLVVKVIAHHRGIVKVNRFLLNVRPGALAAFREHSDALINGTLVNLHRDMLDTLTRDQDALLCSFCVRVGRHMLVIDKDSSESDDSQAVYRHAREFGRGCQLLDVRSVDCGYSGSVAELRV